MVFLNDTLLPNHPQKKNGSMTSRKEITLMMTTMTFGVWHRHFAYGEEVQDIPPSKAARDAPTYLSVPERRVSVNPPLVRAKAQ